MPRRLFNLVALLSVLWCAGAAALWLRGRYAADELRWEGRDVTAALVASRGRVLAYHASRLSGDALSRGRGQFVRESRAPYAVHLNTWLPMSPNRLGFAHSAGVAQGTRLRYLVFPLWAAALPPLVAPALWLRRAALRRRRARRAAAGRCARCGYDLTGNVSGVCPECGAPEVDTLARCAGTQAGAVTHNASAG